MNKINKILWPIYVYMILLAMFYSGRDLSTPIMISTFVILILPIVLLGITIGLLRLNYKTLTSKLLFSYCLIPGIILGLQLGYGLYAMGHGENIFNAIIPFFITGLFFGLIFGLLGIWINFIINRFKG